MQDILDPGQEDVPSPLAANGRLFGVLAPSDAQFGSFISPMTKPVYFEDPRTLTVFHLPESSSSFESGGR